MFPMIKLHKYLKIPMQKQGKEWVPVKIKNIRFKYPVDKQTLREIGSMLFCVVGRT